jgi:sulfonate transport system permease protein
MEDSAVSVRPAALRFEGFAVNTRLVRRIASPLVLLLAWQIGSMTHVIPATKLAAPTTILATFWSLLLSGELVNDLLVSLTRVAVGLILGVAIGTGARPAGRPLAASATTRSTRPCRGLRTLPYLGMAPLLILWFGIGELPKIALVAFASAFPIYMTLLGGIRSVDPKLIEAAKVFGLNRAQTIRAVILPGALAPALDRPALRARRGLAEPRGERTDQRR